MAAKPPVRSLPKSATARRAHIAPLSSAPPPPEAWVVYSPPNSPPPDPEGACPLPRVDAPDPNQALLVGVSGAAALAAARNIAHTHPDTPIVLWAWRLAEALAYDAEHDFPVVYGWPDPAALTATYVRGAGASRETLALLNCESAFGFPVEFMTDAAVAAGDVNDGGRPLGVLLGAVPAYASAPRVRCIEVVSELWSIGMRPARALIFEQCMTVDDMRLMTGQQQGTVALEPQKIPAEVAELLPAWQRDQYQAVPYALGNEGELLLVATSKPATDAMRDTLAEAAGMDVKLVPATPARVTASLKVLADRAASADDPTAESATARRRQSELNWRSLTDGTDEAARAVGTLLADAVAREASDVHLDTQIVAGVEEVIARVRVLDDLVEHNRWDPTVGAAIMYRLRHAAITDPSQLGAHSGQCDITIPSTGGDDSHNGRFDLRMEVMPLRSGRMLVVRLLPQERSGRDTLDTVFPPHQSDVAEMMRHALDGRKGLILVSGPTGSGKSTTLAAALHYVARPERKVVSVEDPVESLIPGVQQVPVSPSLEFPDALRAFLRCDPDMIMVGEIRDAETARCALEASQTGHPLLSTVHANDAAGAPVRLANMGADRMQLAEELTLIVAQRLVRRLCRGCTVASPNPTAAGCQACKFTGFEGRAALAETLVVDEEAMALIEVGAAPRALRGLGAYTPFDVHARSLIESRVTTTAEIERALGRPMRDAKN